MDAILTKNVIKNYGSNKVVRNLNLTVPKGAIYGFIGKKWAEEIDHTKWVVDSLMRQKEKLNYLGNQ